MLRAVDMLLVIIVFVCILLNQSAFALGALILLLLVNLWHLLDGRTTPAPPPATVAPDVSQSAPPEPINPLKNDLRHVNERLRVTLASARDGILLLDEEGHLVECNSAAERLLGITRERFLGGHFVDMLDAMMHANELNGFGYARAQLTELARQLRLEPNRVTRRQFTSVINGETYHIEEISSPVYDTDHANNNNMTVIGRLLVLRDMTEHQELLNFREQVLNMAVHDLRGPLTAIINGIDLTLHPEANPRADEIPRILRLCLDSGYRLMRQIEGMLDIAQFEDKTLPIYPASIEPKLLISEAYDALANTFLGMRVTLETTIAPNVPAIMVDPDLIRRVIVNLIDNALRFTPRGDAMHVDVILSSNTSPSVLINISDNGPGIPPERRSLVFQPYGQHKDTQLFKGRRGFGLGLTFCKLAVEAHGGEIWIEGAHHNLKGVCFSVRLPINQ